MKPKQTKTKQNLRVVGVDANSTVPETVNVGSVAPSLIIERGSTADRLEQHRRARPPSTAMPRTNAIVCCTAVTGSTVQASSSSVRAGASAALPTRNGRTSAPRLMLRRMLREASHSAREPTRTTATPHGSAIVDENEYTRIKWRQQQKTQH